MLNKQNRCKTFCTDELMRQVWFHLVRDMRSSFGDSTFLTKQEKALRASIVEFRNCEFPAKFQATPEIFKAVYQLENLFKRYTFHGDVYSSEERSEITNQKFFDLQAQLGAQPVRTLRSYYTVQKARRIVKDILGPFDADEHKTSCRFGKRACKGVPARNAYIDSKLMDVTGSDAHIEWFINDYLPGDKVLQDALTTPPFVQWDERSRYTRCDSLDATNVPKSWKIDRGICPNTVLGSFYTYGIGSMIQSRLAKIGLNIKHLQRVHKALAQRYSINRRYVTADLSNASNSYTFWLLAMLLPRDWLAAIKRGRVPYTMFGESKVLTMSYMMMGIGYTFTLQTLLFYALIRAVQQLLGDSNGKVSVYGDDLIYPKRIHVHVKSVLNDLGFNLNEDKTYVDTHFRESCGGDYFHGKDVRPFQPEGQHQLLTGKPYVLLLYKTINGLCARWEEAQINQTLNYLYREILRVDRTILVVPHSFPDYSGAKIELLNHESHHPQTPDEIPIWDPVPRFAIPIPIWRKPIWSKNIFEWRFMAYKYEAYDRPVIREYAYYWEALRSGSHADLDTDPNSAILERVIRANYKGLPALKLRREELTMVAKEYDGKSENQMIRFKKAPHQPKNYRSKLSGRRLEKLIALVARKGGQRITVAVTPTEPTGTNPCETVAKTNARSWAGR